jgi:hypothetical protein
MVTQNHECKIAIRTWPALTDGQTRGTSLSNEQSSHCFCPVWAPSRPDLQGLSPEDPDGSNKAHDWAVYKDQLVWTPSEVVEKRRINPTQNWTALRPTRPSACGIGKRAEFQARLFVPDFASYTYFASADESNWKRGRFGSDNRRWACEFLGAIEALAKRDGPMSRSNRSNFG